MSSNIFAISGVISGSAAFDETSVSTVGGGICPWTPTEISSATVEAVCAWAASEDHSVADVGAMCPEKEGREDFSGVVIYWFV